MTVSVIAKAMGLKSRLAKVNREYRDVPNIRINNEAQWVAMP
jgi:ribosomal protein L39E